MASETPSPIRDEGWFGPGGRRFLAIGITLIVLGVGAYYLIGGREEIGDFLDELSTTSDEPTTTLEDATIDSGGLAPPGPVEPVPETPEKPVPPPGSPEADQQLREAERQLDCIQQAQSPEQMAQCL